MAGASSRYLVLLLVAAWLMTNAIRSLFRDQYWSTRFAAIFQIVAGIMLAMFLGESSNYNNGTGSAKVIKAFMGALILLLFMAGISMVVEKTPPDSPTEKNKKWFGVAYICFSGILGLYFIYDNVVASSNI